VLCTQFAVEKLSEHNQKRKPNFFFVSSATSFSKKACFVVQGFAKDKKKREKKGSNCKQNRSVSKTTHQQKL